MSVTNAKKNFVDGDYLMGHEKLKWTNAATYLGVTLTNKMSWSAHINNTAAKARRALGFLWRNIDKCPRPIKQKVYVSFVTPIMEYSGAVWDAHYKQDVDQLETVMGKRHVRSAPDQDSVTDMIAELGWPSVQERRQAAAVTMLYKMKQ